MPIKVYRNKFEHVHENIFFRKLALELIERYKYSKGQYAFIGNPVITDQDGQRVAPDALFISSSSFVIIDFKNYSGELELPEPENFRVENWTINGKSVKGGNQKNPYIQLSKHKQKIGDYIIFNKAKFLSKNSKFHTRFIDCVVSFTSEVSISGSIPNEDKNWFFIADKNTVLPTLEDITSTRINLSDGDLERLAHLFSTTLWNPEDKFKVDEEQDLKSEIKYSLTTEQNNVFAEVEKFLKNDEQQILILSGSFSCGKTFLINHIINNIPKNTIKGCEVLAPHNRIARNVRKQVESVNTLYSYVFKFSEEIEVEVNDKELEIELENDESEGELTDTKLIFNIRENNDPESYLYIVDEAHHLTDSGFISDNIQFGTGYLLSDFLTFANIEESKRKIIFVGDNYRLGYGSYEESALCSSYLKSNYFLDCKELEIPPYPPTNNNIVKQAFNIRGQIIKDQYNQLELIDSDLVKVSKSGSHLKESMAKHFGNELYNTKILSYSNDNISQSNNWVRKNVLNKNNELEKGDILLIENDVVVAPDNPFAVPQRIFKGEFAEVITVGDEIEPITQPFKGRKPVVIKYRELRLKLIERNLEVSVLSNLNYWVSKDISKEEYIAQRIYISRKIGEQIKEEKNSSEDWREFKLSQKYLRFENTVKELTDAEARGEQVKTKLKEAKADINRLEKQFWKKRRIELNREIKFHDKYINALNLNYGYALTVHKAQSYKWKNIFFNLNPDGRGTSNKQYFKWVYSGIGCAIKRLFLINPPYITPYSKLEWRDNHNCTVKNESSDFFPFTEETPVRLIDKPKSFEDKDDVLYHFYCWISRELASLGVIVNSVLHHNYAEHYNIENSKGDRGKLIIYYDGQNRFKRHQIVTSTNDEFKKEVDEFLTMMKSNSINLYNSGLNFSDTLFEKLYDHIKSDLESKNIELVSVKEGKFSDRFIFKSDDDLLMLDVFLNSEGFLTTVYPIKCNSASLYDELKIIFYDFIDKNGKSITES
ncbi:NERD domain-containing protein [Winogradskyella poriferorum]